MQHRNNASNAWLITQLNALLDLDKNGKPIWEKECRGVGDKAMLYSAVLQADELSQYHTYLTKKGIKCTLQDSRLIVPVATQAKKSRFNVEYKDVSNPKALPQIITMLNDATPSAFGKWEVTANQHGQHKLFCNVHGQHDDDSVLTNMITTILSHGAFSEESKRSIKHHFLDNLYVEKHDNYKAYSIIDLAYIEQIAMVTLLS